MEDNLENIRKLRSRIDDIAKELNLERNAFILMPGEVGDENDIIQIMFKIKIEALESDEKIDARKINDSFQLILEEEFGKSDDNNSDEVNMIKQMKEWLDGNESE